MNQEVLHTIAPIKVFKLEGKYYSKRPSFNNEMSKHFDLQMYVQIEEVESLDFDKYLQFDENIKFSDFFDEVNLLHFIKNFFKYKKKIEKLPKEDLYHIPYPFKRIGVFLAFLLRKRKLSIRVKTDMVSVYKNNIFKIFGFSVKTTIKAMLAPFKIAAYTLISKFLFSNNLIFYTANATINRNNHINQHEIISCSKFNRDKSIIKKDMNHNLVFVGGESGQKGLHILLKSLNRSSLKEKIKLNIIGIDSINKDKNKKLSNSLDIETYGEVYDRDKFYNILSDNDILVMPSFGEKQGKVQLEAMSAGVVPICSDSGGTYMTVNNFYNGLLFKSGDFVSLKNHIERLYKNPDLYKNLQQNGLDYIGRFSEEREVEKVSKIMKNFYE